MADKNAVDVSQMNNPLSKKLNKILDIRLDSDKEILDSLKSLSTFFVENSLRSRRNLRGDIERQSLSINEEFVDAFRVVQKQLDEIYQNVKGMNECCQDMTDRLKTAKEQTHDLINQTTQLQAENQTLAMKSRVAEAFLDKFQLTSDQVKTLRGTRDGQLHKDFFDVLARVKQIHTDCKVLLRTNQQTAGLEIMESMAMHQEAAYERLYRWTQNECRQLSNDSPDISNLLCQAMNALQDRPVLFRYSLDEFGIARRTAIVRGFIDALTRGGPGGTPRPIELHSHDPFRYTGDMLAWLHHSAYSEKEHLQTLLKNSEWLATNDLMQDILGHITEGICRPFKVRVEQVVVSESDIVTLYRLTNLLKFYQSTMTQILTKHAALLATVVDMEMLSRKMFFNSLNCHSSKIVEKVDVPPPDLSCPPALTQTLQLLQDILASHDSSVTTLDARQHDFQEILACMIEPLIQMCSVSAAQLMTADMATYMVNCIHVIQKTLALYEFTDQRLEMLQAQLDAHLDTLVSEQASFVLGRSGLATVYNTVTQHQPKHGPLSQLENMDAVTLRSSMNRFDNYLANPDSLLMPQCALLISGLVRDKIKRSSTDVIVQAYKQMYQAVMDPVNKYKDPQTIVPRTAQQVQELLPVS